jgi:hypothetical protein
MYTTSTQIHFIDDFGEYPVVWPPSWLAPSQLAPY